jgi:ribonuclease P protein component
MVLTESLKKNNDFKSVYSLKESYANKLLVMYIRKNDENKNRLGISVSKKVGNSVIRHRITRLIRESYRKYEKNIESGYDIVIIARTTSKDRSFKDIEKALLHLLKLHKLLKIDDLNL